MVIYRKCLKTKGEDEKITITKYEEEAPHPYILTTTDHGRSIATALNQKKMRRFINILVEAISITEREAKCQKPPKVIISLSGK